MKDFPGINFARFLGATQQASWLALLYGSIPSAPHLGHVIDFLLIQCWLNAQDQRRRTSRNSEKVRMARPLNLDVGMP